MRYRYFYILMGLMLGHGAFAEDWTGTWIFKFGPGAVQPVKLLLSQEGGNVKAVWNYFGTEFVSAHVKAAGNTLSIKFGNGPGGLVMHGVLNGDKLLLTSNYMRSGDYQGEDMKEFQHMDASRVSAADLARLDADFPKSIRNSTQPLPSLHDVAGNGLARTPPMGWGNWVGTDDKTVREIADAMVAGGFRDAGYVYLVIDSGWQGTRDANGMIHPNGNFPDMKALAGYVHARGLKLGLYSSPGPLDCTGRLGSHGYEGEDAKTYAQWGIDYLKYDWCSAENLYKTQPQMRALYQKMGDALRATGRPIVYSLCQYGRFDVGSWGRKAGGNLWRTTGDINNNYASMTDNGFDKNGAPKNAGPGGWNDPDDLQIGKGMTTEEDRTQMTLWAILSAPLLMSHDPRHVKPQTREILLNKEVIAIDQDALGRQGHKAQQAGTSEIWVKSLADGSIAVGLFNRATQSTTIDVRWSDLGLRNVPMVRDLWKHADLGPLRGGYQADIPAHGAVLLKVRHAETTP